MADDTGDSLQVVPFATVDDLAARWRVLTDSEKRQAETLLDDASDLIRAECPRYADASLLTLKRIACAIAKRSMLAGADAAGISQSSQTAGPFTESLTYANPAGDLYLTNAEKRSLGCKRQRAFTIDLSGGGSDA